MGKEIYELPPARFALPLEKRIMVFKRKGTILWRNRAEKKREKVKFWSIKVKGSTCEQFLGEYLYKRESKSERVSEWETAALND